jgi:hypothetical protein
MSRNDPSEAVELKTSAASAPALQPLRAGSRLGIARRTPSAIRRKRKPRYSESGSLWEKLHAAGAKRIVHAAIRPIVA